MWPPPPLSDWQDWEQWVTVSTELSISRSIAFYTWIGEEAVKWGRGKRLREKKTGDREKGSKGEGMRVRKEGREERR